MSASHVRTGASPGILIDDQSSSSSSSSSEDEGYREEDRDRKHGTAPSLVQSNSSRSKHICDDTDPSQKRVRRYQVESAQPQKLDPAGTSSSTSITSRRPNTRSQSHSSDKSRALALSSPQHLSKPSGFPLNLNFFSPRLDRIVEDAELAAGRYISSSRRHHRDRHHRYQGRDSRHGAGHSYGLTVPGDGSKRKKPLGAGSKSSSSITFAHQHPSQHLTSPSLLSVLSGLTTSTSSSSGSNDTVTQSSFTSKDPMSSTESKVSSSTRQARGRKEQRGSSSTSAHRSKKTQTKKERQSMETASISRYLESDPTADVSQQQQQQQQRQAAKQAQAYRSSSSSSSEYDSSDDHSSMTDATSITKSSGSSPHLSFKNTKTTPSPFDLQQPLKDEKTKKRSKTSSSLEKALTPILEQYRVPVAEEAVEDEDEDEEKVVRPIGSSSSGSGSNSSEEDEISKRTRRLSASAFHHINEHSRPPSYSAHDENVPPRAPSVPPNFSHIPPPDFSSLPSPTLIGYELLASKLSSAHRSTAAAHPQPIYRKFEAVNHRILLQIQDEISELEERLRQIEETIAQMSKNPVDGSCPPTSRRAGPRYGHMYEYQRLDVLGKLYSKMCQYSQAMSAFKTIAREHEPASLEDIASYRAWMKVHAPIDETETRFLQHSDDLIRVVPRLDASSGSRSSNHEQPMPKPEAEGIIARIKSTIQAQTAVLAALLGPITAIITFSLLRFLSGSASARWLAMLVMAVAMYIGIKLKMAGSCNGNCCNHQHSHSHIGPEKIQAGSPTSAASRVSIAEIMEQQLERIKGSGVGLLNDESDSSTAGIANKARGVATVSSSDDSE